MLKYVFLLCFIFHCYTLCTNEIGSCQDNSTNCSVCNGANCGQVSEDLTEL